MKLRINAEDIIQIAIGTFALVMPISFTEGAWKMNVTLPFLISYWFFYFL